MSAPEDSAPRPTPAVGRLTEYHTPPTGRSGLLRLDLNENTVGASLRVLEKLRSITAEELAIYPDEAEARRAVAAHLKLPAGLEFVLVPGVDEGIRLLCDCFLSAGDRIVIPEPAFPMYRFYSTIRGAEIVPVSYQDDLSFPGEAVARAADGGCRMLVLADPNNPTGTPVPEGFVAAIAAKHPGTLIFVDEAYTEFGGRSTLADLPALPNVVVGRTFSKAFGLAGLRAGVLIGNQGTISWLARARSPFAVNGLALRALPAALEDVAFVTRYAAQVREARALLAGGLKDLGIATFPSSGNFLIAKVGEQAAEITAALRRRGILVKNTSHYPLLAGTLRIGLGTPDQIAALLAALREIVPAPAATAQRRV